MKNSKIFKTLLILAVLIGTERFCRSQTAGFRCSKAMTHHVYPFKAEIGPPPPVLDQTFYFLGSGVQCYAFLGEDGETVLKFFKHHHGGLSTDFLKKVLPKKFMDPIIAQRERRVCQLLKSAQIASQFLPKETGLFYTHLGKTDGIHKKVTLVDKLGIKHQLDLDQAEFVLQKRADPLETRLNQLFSSGKTTEAVALMKKLLTFLEYRTEKGIKNKDGKIIRNCGFIGDEPVEMDIGSFAFARSSGNHKTFLKATKRLLLWVQKNYPDHFAECKKELENNDILRPLKKCEKCQGGDPEFESGEADVEAAKLKKLSDADGSQIQWQSDAGRFTLFERSQYNSLLLLQPFHFLGKGKQSLAYLGKDQVTVLKIFKPSRKGKKRLLKSIHLAEKELQTETALLYLKYPYCLQKKATLLLPYLEKHPSELPAMIDSLFETLRSCIQKGISNKDPLIDRNLGVVDGKVILIDIGAFVKNSPMKNLTAQKREFFYQTLELEEWIGKNAPDAKEYFEKKRLEILEQMDQNRT